MIKHLFQGKFLSKKIVSIPFPVCGFQERQGGEKGGKRDKDCQYRGKRGADDHHVICAMNENRDNKSKHGFHRVAGE